MYAHTPWLTRDKESWDLPKGQRGVWTAPLLRQGNRSALVGVLGQRSSTEQGRRGKPVAQERGGAPAPAVGDGSIQGSATLMGKVLVCATGGI